MEGSRSLQELCGLFGGISETVCLSPQVSHSKPFPSRPMYQAKCPSWDTPTLMARAKAAVAIATRDNLESYRYVILLPSLLLILHDLSVSHGNVTEDRSE